MSAKSSGVVPAKAGTHTPQQTFGEDQQLASFADTKMALYR
ncbi:MULTISPECIES: hypothetical protein [unclassified Bradyrhizobium]|nr:MULTISPECIES: hypothetical protein [unclassified Bradyrhizobium]